MISGYGKYIVFKSNDKEPIKGIVDSVGEDVKGISIGDTIYVMDYATHPILGDNESFAVNKEHIFAVDKK